MTIHYLSRLGRNILALAWILVSTFMVHKAANAQEEQFRCSATEFPIISDVPLEIDDVPIFIRNPKPGFGKDCKFTFTTEAATSQQGLQLMLLSYVRQQVPIVTFPPDPVPPQPPTAACEFPATSPVITQVNGGIDETHTFINPGFGLPEQSPTNFDTRIRPCLSTSGEFRIRNHCLIVECREFAIIP